MLLGPNIITDGLVTYFDVANVDSFRGEPTVNLASNMDTRSYSNWSGATSTREVVNEYPIELKGSEQVIRLQSSGGTSVLKFFFGISGLVEFDQATFRGRVYNNNPSSSLILLFNSFSISTITIPPLTYADLSNRSGVVGSGSEQIQFRASSSDDVIDCYISEFQIEKRSYSTPFVNGTRGNTVATGGGVADISNNNNHAEFLASTFNSSNLGSIVFDGTDDYLNLSGNNTWNMFASSSGTIGNNFTICAWIYPTNIGTDQAIVSQRHGDAMSLFLMSNGKVTFEMDDTGNWVGTNTVLQNNNWYYVVVTFYNNTSNSYCEYYVNGIFERSETKWDSNGVSPVSDLWIGWQSRTNYGRNPGYFAGRIPLVKIFNRALTADEILQNFNSTKSRFGLS
jgi:hypothetical protein